MVGGMFSQFQSAFLCSKEIEAEDWGVYCQDPCDNFFLEFKFRNKRVSKDRFKCFGFVVNNHY